MFIVDRRHGQVERRAGRGARPIIHGKIEAVARRFAAIVRVGDLSAIDIGLRKRITRVQRHAAEIDRAVGWRRVDRVDQLRRRIVHVAGGQLAAGDRTGAAFAECQPGVGIQ